MDRSRRPVTAARRWLVDDWEWPYAGALASCFLVAVAPVVWSAEGAALALVLLLLPAYMLHQVEEHAADRFRRYVNGRLAGGREALTRGITFAINVIAVWALFTAAFLLAYYVDPALGLIAAYGAAANALIHVVAAAVRGEYNPGLVTAVVLLGPLGTWTAIEVNSTYATGAGIQALAIAIAIGAHLAIVAMIGARLRRQRPPAH